MPHATKSALQDAREAFIAGLARRADALRPVVESFIADPGARVVRAELQRRLHSLLASAQLFEEPSLVAQLQRLTSRLDAVGLDTEAWQKTDSDLLLSLLTSLDPEAARAQVSGIAPARGPMPVIEPVVQAPQSSEPSPRSERHVTQVGHVAEAAQVAQVANETSVRPPSSAGRPANRPPAPAMPTHQVGAVMLTRVLLVCSRPHAAELRSLLDEAPLELLHAADPEQALALIERCSPSYALIAAEFATLPDIDLVTRLREDPHHPVEGAYLMLPHGATYDVEFVRQTGADGVLIEPISWEMLGPLLDRASPPTADSDAEPAGDAQEDTEPNDKLSLAGGLSEAFAQAQSAAAEAHRNLIESGRVMKARPPAVAQAVSAPPPLEAAQPKNAPTAISGAPAAVVEQGRARPLIGRRVLVVDDDPAMLWFFSGVVRDAGGEALQARDGAEGVEIARRKRPQLVLSDILMPKLDGFALRRALGRDLYLERTPVLLLSWKGDPAEDIEGRPNSASGFLRKEASVPEVLAAIERALSPRQQLEQVLRAEGDVTGQVDDLGIVALIECVVSARPDVRLTLEDAADLFEVAIADANQISVTRTAADGTFTRGERALLQLIGVTHGRFHVSKRSTSLRSPVQTPLKPALHAAVSEISALIDSVSSDRIAQVARLTFDEDLLSSRLPDVPTIHPIVSDLRANGMSPARLLGEGKCSSGELAACLMPLARQAVLTGVWNADGKDLLADITRLHMPRPSLPPALPEPPAAAAPSPSPEPEPQPQAATIVEPAAVASDPGPPPPELQPAEPASVEPAETSRVDEIAAPAVASEEVAPQPEPELVPVAKAAEPDPDFESDPEADFQLHTNPVLIAEIAAARRRGREGVLLIATLAASAVLGYIGALQFETHPALFGRINETIGSRGLDEQLMAASPTSETSVRSGLDASFGLGTVLPYIDTTRGVPVGNDEGLVIFEYVGPLPTPNVEIDGRVLGSPPLSVALAATPHQLKLWFAGQPTTRTLSVRAGETRVITLPLSKP